MPYNSEEIDEILSIFKVESEEIIQDINDGLLLLEKNPEDKTPLKKLFQLAHSLKGAARMLGFNSIQDISHKLEDILSYWKRDDVNIEKDSFQIIYEACDLLSAIIKKSVEKKIDFSNENTMLFINKLKNFIASHKILSSQNKEELSEKGITNKITDINAIILELMFLLEKDDNNDSIENVVSVILDNLNSLLEIFKNTNYENIIQSIQNIINIISSNNKHSNGIFNEYKEKIINLRNDIYNLYKELNIKHVIPEKKTENIANNNKDDKENKTEETKLSEKFDGVLQNLPKIKFEKEYIIEICNSLEEIRITTKNKKIELIIDKTLNILKLFKKKNITIDNDCYMVILQCIYLAKRILLNEKEDDLNNLNFLIQRLSVVEDMFNISDSENIPDIPEKNRQIAHITTKDNIDKFKENISSIELQEIKTLRVDTGKLDNLISQTGELLVNGIKTREHLVELSGISSKLINWNNESKKINNYLKYIEKRGLFSIDHDENAALFYKKAQSFFLNNAEVISDIQSAFNNLYNIISEDDNKLHQTAMEIETIAKGIRVLPLATIFHSFPRMIRDIAKENNKKIDFIVSGSDTTVDKKIIEEIKIPLIHILRNAISHGIEVPEERLKNGKKETGIIKLTAKQAENNVIISIEDDGYGINLEKVKQTAISRGLLFQEEIDNMDNEQLMKLLFLPGFSTEDSITEISGRGIGLDIVKTKINNLNGEIYIDSVLNKGCRVTIKLPVSMSTIKTFIIMAGEQKYAIPVTSIKFVKLIKKDEIFNKNGQDCIIFEEHSIPIYSLSKIFGETTSFSQEEKELTVIIIENQEKQAAYITDKLLGDQEVFHRKMMPPIMKIRNISGFTTLSTGELCLIINPYELIRNTTVNNSIPAINTLQKIENKNNNKRILILRDGIEFVKEDISDYFKNIYVEDNISSLYEKMKKEIPDILICRMIKGNEELLEFLRHIKNDENLNVMKIVIISELSIFELVDFLKDFKPDLYIKQAEYNKEDFIKSLNKI